MNYIYITNIIQLLDYIMNFKMLNDLFNFILVTSNKYNIDESHDISHSMNVLHYAHNIYESQIYTNPGLKPHKNIIYLSAALHDMCDKKYMDESEGITAINDHLKLITTPEENDIITKIIRTMSYSKVKKDGFPDLGIYQSAYHVVREADLLTAYDFDRALIYDMKANGKPFIEAYEHAENLFHTRVFKHAEDKLFTTDYALSHYPELHYSAIHRINTWKNMVVKPIRQQQTNKT